MTTAGSALAELRERLAANGVDADPQRVATALLGLANLNGWARQPERMTEWLGQLALDLASATARAG